MRKQETGGGGEAGQTEEYGPRQASRLGDGPCGRLAQAPRGSQIGAESLALRRQSEVDCAIDENMHRATQRRPIATASRARRRHLHDGLVDQVTTQDDAIRTLGG